MPRTGRTYEFGDFRVDEDQRVLMRGDDVVSLTPKAFDTLLTFVQNSALVLEKEWLLEAIWPDTFVEEANLAVNVSLLRKVLGERPEGGGYIDTVPRRGYRFAVPVRVTGENSGITPPLAPPQPVEESGERPRFIVKRPPEIKYARSGDVNIAYQVVGDGPIDVVFVMGWVSHLEYYWKNLEFARFLSRLASFARLILFDKRGTGLSDRVSLNELPTLEQRMDDVRAVMDAAAAVNTTATRISRDHRRMRC